MGTGKAHTAVMLLARALRLHASILRILFQQYVLFPLSPFTHHFKQTIPVSIRTKALT